MSIRNKLLEEIDRKAKRIQERRVEASNNKSLEAFVFEFFRHAEQARFLHNNDRYDDDMLKSAITSLREKLRLIDNKAKVSIEFNRIQDQQKSMKDTIKGVTIFWSPHHVSKNNCHPTLYIDVSNMLFI